MFIFTCWGAFACVYGEVRNVSLQAPSPILLRQDSSLAWTLTMKNDLVGPWVSRDCPVSASHPAVPEVLTWLCLFFLVGSGDQNQAFTHTGRPFNDWTIIPRALEIILILWNLDMIFKYIFLYLWAVLKFLHRKVSTGGFRWGGRSWVHSQHRAQMLSEEESRGSNSNW